MHYPIIFLILPIGLQFTQLQIKNQIPLFLVDGSHSIYSKIIFPQLQLLNETYQTLNTIHTIVISNSVFLVVMILWVLHSILKALSVFFSLLLMER